MKPNKSHTITRQIFIANQKELCHRLSAPSFMPADGMCYKCGSDVISALIKRGENGSKELVTGCPICHRSYCE